MVSTYQPQTPPPSHAKHKSSLYVRDQQYFLMFLRFLEEEENIDAHKWSFLPLKLI